MVEAVEGLLLLHEPAAVVEHMADVNGGQVGLVVVLGGHLAEVAQVLVVALEAGNIVHFDVHVGPQRLHLPLCNHLVDQLRKNQELVVDLFEGVVDRKGVVLGLVEVLFYDASLELFSSRQLEEQLP